MREFADGALVDLGEVAAVSRQRLLMPRGLFGKSSWHFYGRVLFRSGSTMDISETAYGEIMDALRE